MGVPISSLPAASALTGAELFPVVQSGQTKRTTTDAIPYVPAGTGAVTTTVQTKLREFVSVGDKGIVSDGATDQTAALVALMTALSGAGFRGWIKIPYNTKFTVSTVYAAVPVGVVLDDESSINWGQPPGYKNRFKIMFSGDSVSDDTQTIIASGHNVGFTLLNTGTAGTTSGQRRYGTIQHAVNIGYNKDPVYSWLQQFGKSASANTWQIGWRLQTPYSVAIANPSLWAAATVYPAGAYCISDSGKIYTTASGGTSGVTAPTGTGASISDGGVTWSYVQAALNIDSTIFVFDESGNFQFRAISGSPKLTQASGSKSHYFQIDGSTGNITWRDESRSLNIATVTDAGGLQFGVGQSANRQTMSGTGPTAPTTGFGQVSNAGATNMSTIVPISGRDKMILNLRFNDANTTLVHGTGANALTLKGAVNASPPQGSYITLEYDNSFSGRWFEVSRSF